VSISDPRFSGTQSSSFRARRDQATYRCGKRSTALQELPAARARQLLAAAEFREVSWTRVPHVLARDENGSYYYVDEILRQKDVPASGQRIFAGPRGGMKQLRMRNLVADDAGEIYITADGRLRLVLDRASEPPAWRATWVRGAKRQVLTVVDVENAATRRLIYNELGVYSGVKLQRPCDVW